MSAKYKYSWTKAYPVDAQTVGNWLQSIKVRTADQIVAAARDPVSPVHSLFEWDDSAGAEQYRLVQARVMIGSLRVEIVNANKKVERVSAFIHTSDRGRYAPTLEATIEELTEAEEQCLMHMRTFKTKWRGLSLAAMWSPPLRRLTAAPSASGASGHNSYGRARRGLGGGARLGKAGVARMEWRGAVRRGVARQGMARLGSECPGRRGDKKGAAAP
jgi:hypothetical protein